MIPHGSTHIHVVRRVALLFALLCVLPRQVDAQASLAVGGSLYGSDEFCLDSEALLTSYQASARGSSVGFSVSYNNSSWPWPTPPGGGNEDRIDGPTRFGGAAFQEAAFLSQGEAARAVVEVFALPLLDRLTGGEGGLSQLDDRFSPFLGIGVQYSTDGNPEPAGGGRDLPVYGVKGSTDLLLVAGASVVLPLTDRAGLLLQLRGNSLQAGDAELELPTGEIITTESGTRNWAEWLVGLSFGLGG